MSTYYRVRKSWEDSKSQLGAFITLANAISVADGQPEYSVFDDNGKLVYKPLFRVRKSVNDSDSQLGAFSIYDNAVALADKNDGYHVYDYLGVVRYPLPFKVQFTETTNYYAAENGITKVGGAEKGVYTITRVKSPYGYLKSGAGWVNLTGLDVYTPVTTTPLSLAADNVESVYEQCIGCTHVSGNYTWTKAMEKKQVNCSIPASRVATIAGLIADGKRISHTSAVSKNILTSKNTINKSMNGYDYLKLSKCSVKYVGKKYSALADKYKKKGAIFIYDSNIAVYGGDGSIYACHEWSRQMSDGKYTKVKLTSGYCFTSPILVVILPNN